MTRPLLVIDGDSFAHRSYHGLPKTIRRRGNKGGGAILGFANFLLRLYETEQPRAVLAAWDSLDEPTYRNEALPAYQSGREFDDELVDQLEILPDFVTACGFANAKAAGYEADDFLAAAAAKEERRKGTVVVATGDRDAYQLASPKTTILQPIKAGEMARIGSAEVRERYGVEPAQVPDFIALRGDASDKIPGAKGVGPKTAAGLLVKYGSLEKLLGAGRFAAQADELRLYRSVARMDRSAPLPALKNQTPTWAKASALARQWELNRLADRLAELAQAHNWSQTRSGAAMKSPDREIEFAIEVFVRGHSVVRSRTFPHEASRVGPLWVMRDAPRRNPRDYRKEDWIAYGVDAQKVDAIARRHTRGRFFVCSMIAEGESDQPTRAAYKAMGYRLLATEGFFVQRLKRVPRLPSPASIERIRTPELAAKLGKVTRTRPIASDLLRADAPFRQYVALDGEEIVGRVRSVDAAGATWCADMYVKDSHRRRGIGKALLSRMLRDDRAHGSTCSVLTASHTGALLYPHVGYERIGTLLMLVPRREKPT